MDTIPAAQNDRLPAFAMFAGCILMLLTLAFHPGGPIKPEQIDDMVRKLVAVHSLALAAIPLLFFGVWGVARRLGFSRDFVVLALVVYGFAVVALLAGVVFDGLVTPTLLHKLVPSASSSTPSAPAGTTLLGTVDIWRALFAYNTRVASSFVKVFLPTSSSAVALFSVAMLRTRGYSRILPVYGLLIALATIGTQFAGRLDLESHKFLFAIVLQVLWLLAAALPLLRPSSST